MNDLVKQEMLELTEEEMKEEEEDGSPIRSTFEPTETREGT
jgi:hypothetical protein